VTRQTPWSDAEGRATFAFDTPKAGGRTEFTSRRVTDASPPRDVGGGRSRVAAARGARDAGAQRPPAGRWSSSVRRLDLNENPVEAGGRVTVARNR
jgi:hypothetical protein